MSRASGENGLLLHVLDEAVDKAAWHGPNLRGSLRGVTARQAAWRPAPRRHNIRELALHAAYWAYRVRCRLTGEKTTPFPIPGSNFFHLPDPTEKQWRAEREIVEREHRALRRVVAAYPASRLRKKIPGTVGRTPLREIAGVALHGVYHAGQIQTLKALYRGRKR